MQRKTDFSDDPLAPKPYIKERPGEPPDSVASGSPAFVANRSPCRRFLWLDELFLRAVHSRWQQHGAAAERLFVEHMDEHFLEAADGDDLNAADFA